MDSRPARLRAACTSIQALAKVSAPTRPSQGGTTSPLGTPIRGSQRGRRPPALPQPRALSRWARVVTTPLPTTSCMPWSRTVQGGPEWVADFSSITEASRRLSASIQALRAASVGFSKSRCTRVCSKCLTRWRASRRAARLAGCTSTPGRVRTCAPTPPSRAATTTPRASPTRGSPHGRSPPVLPVRRELSSSACPATIPWLRITFMPW
mmetsp:Transcript_33914/g.77063  ORF Transcript_33914/g.77063 Transcript_33914/m.77063 type:complete len:209 (-) Transcript_33914:1084-1710(-)